MIIRHETDIDWDTILINLSWSLIYILIIPAFGLISIIISSICHKIIFANQSMIFAMSSISLLGSIVWGHHMYTIGLESDTRAYFTIITIFISLPTNKMNEDNKKWPYDEYLSSCDPLKEWTVSPKMWSLIFSVSLSLFISSFSSYYYLLCPWMTKELQERRYD